MALPLLKLDTKEISRILSTHLFELEHSPICANFQTINLQECDVISVSSSGYLFEFEIKTSVSDFKADFKKTIKHERLKISEGVFKMPKNKKGEERDEFLLCSYFWYVCPACLIRDDMVPDYAGLIWIHYDGRVEYRKPCPQIHAVKADAHILRKISHNLTQKHLFASSYVSYINKGAVPVKVIKTMILEDKKVPEPLAISGRKIIIQIPALKTKVKPRPRKR